MLFISQSPVQYFASNCNSFLCPEQRDYGNLITGTSFSMYTVGVLKNSKFYWNTIIYIYQYSYLFFMNSSKAGCSQSKKKLQMNNNLLKIRLIYDFDCIYHPFLLSIQIQSAIKSLNGKKNT